MTPPSSLVMTTIDGRGGMPSLKSGQRVDGCLEMRGIAVAVLLARMLHGDEQRLVVGREHRAAHLGADRHAEEQLGGAAQPRPRSPSPRSPSVAAGAPWGCCRRWRSTGGPAASTAQLSGMPNQPSLRGAGLNVAPTSAIAGSPHLTRMSQANLVAAWSPSGGVISTIWPNLFSARGLAASTCSALRLLLLVSMTIDLAGLRVGLDVLRPVHLGGAQRVAGAAAPRSPPRPGS